VIFPILVLSVFTWLVSQHASKLFAPTDFRDEANYVRMQLSAAASLGAAASKDLDAAAGPEKVNRIVRLVQDVKLSDKAVDGEWKRRVLWVDDRPENNIYERKAFEAVGIKFALSLNTEDALRQLESHKYAAVISDMGRKEGPREGYALLDEMRKRGDHTPVFFYASSNDPKHKKETAEHGGQGCTNDSGELFEMVTRMVIQTY
jgi:CheY-like chemotaxis protein